MHDASKTTAITFIAKCDILELKRLMQDCPVIIFETDVTTIPQEHHFNSYFNQLPIQNNQRLIKELEFLHFS